MNVICTIIYILTKYSISSGRRPGFKLNDPEIANVVINTVCQIFIRLKKPQTLLLF